VPRRQDILPYLDRLRRDLALPTLYVTHAVEEVAARAEAIVAMDEGRVLSVRPAGC
jgi:molybdate transport system ATP-binding protein